ncbi:hypothetical protein L596_010779 [Steinernema carpocapsae]|uniref:Protein kinase domain-containing protein n=1 Tax=Steinernema carpocapsae TaxID=34508 RepID=A0A4V6A707_STECR|nr:hypothetical protein L596_010779 [Steinernema carpocapsae]
MQERISKTDVWSYGVMLWEIYTHGKEPYPGMSNMQTRAKIIVQNYRMEIPKDTPGEVTKIITECWARSANDRPTFGKIYEVLSAVKLS